MDVVLHLVSETQIEGKVGLHPPDIRHEESEIDL
jgi:hypothetical protein